jgi:glycosyltransferase involved in cell wall biosynthesis
MHILLIHQAFASLDEAGGTRHFELARYLIARGHRVTIIASPISYLSGRSRQEHMQWANRTEPTPGMSIVRTYTYPAFHRSFLHRVITFLSFMVSSFLVGLTIPDVNLVWGTSPPIFQGITAWLLARLKGAAFIFEVRDLWPEFAIGVGVLKNPVLIRASLWLERFLYRHADLVLVNSPGYLEHVSLRGARKVELVPNGADPDMFSSAEGSQEFRNRHHLEKKFVVLYAGAHGMSNDLQVILKAAQRLSDRKDILFLLVGDGKEKQNLQALADQLALTNVVFLPPVPKNEMSVVLGASDACIAILKPLDLYKTTYPNKVFDYMAAGKPVILAIDGVIREVVETARCGIFVPPGNPECLASAVADFAQDPSIAAEMGLSGQEYVRQHFNRTKLADQLANIFETYSSRIP